MTEVEEALKKMIKETSEKSWAKIEEFEIPQAVRTFLKSVCVHDHLREFSSQPILTVSYLKNGQYEIEVLFNLNKGGILFMALSDRFDDDEGNPRFNCGHEEEPMNPDYEQTITGVQPYSKFEQIFSKFAE